MRDIAIESSGRTNNGVLEIDLTRNRGRRAGRAGSEGRGPGAGRAKRFMRESPADSFGSPLCLLSTFAAAIPPLPAPVLDPRPPPLPPSPPPESAQIWPQSPETSRCASLVFSVLARCSRHPRFCSHSVPKASPPASGAKLNKISCALTQDKVRIYPLPFAPASARVLGMTSFPAG